MVVLDDDEWWAKQRTKYWSGLVSSWDTELYVDKDLLVNVLKDGVSKDAFNANNAGVG